MSCSTNFEPFDRSGEIRPSAHDGVLLGLVRESPEAGSARAGAGVAAVRERAEKRVTGLPESRAFMVTGVMDRIRHDDGRFRLRLVDGQTLAGRLDPEAVEIERLREFEGRPATVVGMVHFHPDGRPRLLVARRLRDPEEGDVLLEDLPRGDVPGEPALTPELREKARKFDWNRLKGLWKIERSTEELLAQVREMRDDP